jgi:hypothetical protein
MLRNVEVYWPNDIMPTSQSRIFTNTVVRILNFALTIPSYPNAPNVINMTRHVKLYQYDTLCTLWHFLNFCCVKSNSIQNLVFLLQHTRFDVFHIIMRASSVLVFSQCHALYVPYPNPCQSVSPCRPVFFSHRLTALVGLGPLIVEVPKSHSLRHHTR